MKKEILEKQAQMQEAHEKADNIYDRSKYTGWILALDWILNLISSK